MKEVVVLMTTFELLANTLGKTERRRLGDGTSCWKQ